MVNYDQEHLWKSSSFWMTRPVSTIFTWRHWKWSRITNGSKQERLLSSALFGEPQENIYAITIGGKTPKSRTLQPNGKLMMRTYEYFLTALLSELCCQMLILSHWLGCCKQTWRDFCCPHSQILGLFSEGIYFIPYSLAHPYVWRCLMTALLSNPVCYCNRV